MTTTEADDLVTEEMVEKAVATYLASWSTSAGWSPGQSMAAALRAVAPMIAARAWEPPWIDYRLHALLAAERDACKQIAREHEEASRDLGIASAADAAASIADAIAARGETP
jgi:hypothetical protein